MCLCSFFLVLIAFNTIILATEHYPMSPRYSKFLTVTNMVFTVLFALEILMKLAAKQAEFFKDGLNVFDAIIVVIGIAEIGVSITQSSERSR